MWKQGGLFTLEGSCPDGEISVGLKHLVMMFFFLFFPPPYTQQPFFWSDVVSRNPAFISVKTWRWHFVWFHFKEDVESFSFWVSRVEKKKINRLFFWSLLSVQFSPLCRFYCLYLTTWDCPLTVICSQCVLQSINWWHLCPIWSSQPQNYNWKFGVVGK